MAWREDKNKYGNHIGHIMCNECDLVAVRSMLGMRIAIAFFISQYKSWITIFFFIMLLVMSLPTPNVIGVGHVPISTRI